MPKPNAMIACRKNYPCIIALLLLLFTASAFAQRPALMGIAYVELQTADPVKSMSFYHTLLGYRIQQPIAAASKMPPFFSLKISDRQSIKITGGLPAGQDERLKTVAFQTSDVGRMRLYLEARGIKVTARVTNGMDGAACFSVSDPDGHTITFVQYAIGKGQTEIQQPGISSRILHAGLTISSAPAADKFYKDILGFSEIWRGGATDSVTSWINMRLPESTDYLEYMLVGSPPDRKQLGGLHHIALLVPDMQKALDILNTRIPANYDLAPPRVGRNRRWQLNLFDPDGTRIELMEPFPMR